jgi:hypothetical protein
MQDMSHLDTGVPPHIFEQPTLCAECGLQIGSDLLADECELCGAPRCRSCAREAGGSLADGYICSDCAVEA